MERNRVAIVRGNDVFGVVHFHLAEDAPERHASYGVTDAVAAELNPGEEPAEIARQIKGLVQSTFRSTPLGKLTEYLESVEDRDWYLHCKAALPGLAERIEELEATQDRYRDVVRKYEAEQAVGPAISRMFPSTVP